MPRPSFAVNATVVQGFLEGNVIKSDLERRAKNVAKRARENASGPIIGQRSTDLFRGIRWTIERDSLGLYAVIGTAARHRDFSYPAWHDAHGRPWLRKALEVGWNEREGLQYVRAHRRGIVPVRGYYRRIPGG